MGITTLILITSTLFITALGVVTLLQMTAQEQERVQVQGAAVMAQAGSGIDVLTITGKNAAVKLENLSIRARLHASSNPLVLRATIIELQTRNTTITYHYGESMSVNLSAENGLFAITYIETGTAHQEGMIVRGDLVELALQTPQKLIKREHIKIRIIPMNGIQTTSGFVVPAVITEKYPTLYP